jgi:TonB family protein
MGLAVLALTVLLGGITAAQQQVYDVGDGVTAPTPVRGVEVDYTPAALAERVQGSVLLRAVVGEDGRVRNIEIVQSLHAELDEQASNALRQWEFKPGTRDGKPVAVRIVTEFTFTLK